MVTSGENFSPIGPVLHTKTLVPMKNGFAKKRGEGSRENKIARTRVRLFFELYLW